MTRRILRGGGWFSNIGYYRSAFRIVFTIGFRYVSSGFRLIIKEKT